MKSYFENKIVLVTGGISGIGYEIVKRYSEEGAYVITCGRNDEKGKRLIEELKRKYYKIDFIKCDIGKKRRY